MEKYGLWTVAPISMGLPSSISGIRTSCCAFVNLWISSIKNIVLFPYRLFLSLARLRTSLISATLLVVAFILSK